MCQNSVNQDQGLLLCDIEPPRTRIETSALGWPSCETTFTPANFPCMAWATFITGTAAISFPDTDATEPVRLFFEAEYPITHSSNVEVLISNL
jgi:hypothetical protein